MPEQNPVIYYVYDPLCGWCYGFSPVIQEFYQSHQEEGIEFRVLTGGMILGEKEGPVGEVADYIRQAYPQVEKTTGVSFGKAFQEKILEPGTAQFTSLPGALAMAAFRRYQPDNAIPFAARIQKAIYEEGRFPAEAKTYGQCAEDFGMNAQDFMKLMVDKDLLELVKQEFKVVQQWGIQGFPAVIYQHKEQGYLMTRGYVPLDTLEYTFDKVKEEAR